MSSEPILEVESYNLDDTLRIAASTGSKLQGGEVIELTSDLGGGKTAFVRGLVDGAGSHSPVHSPSFTLMNEYSAPNFSINHFDFYRLHDAGIMRQEISELCGDPTKVVIVEWADIVEDVLPENRLRVRIQVTGEDSRHITFSATDETKYLFPDNS